MAKIRANDISIDSEMQQGESHFAALMGPDREIDANVEILEVNLLQYGLWALMAKVRFLQISGADAEELLANRTPFRIDISTADMDSGTEPQLVVSDEGQFEPGIFSYSKQLQFAIPGPGHYKLHTYLFILLPSSKEITTEYEGPIFEVIS